MSNDAIMEEIEKYNQLVNCDFNPHEPFAPDCFKSYTASVDPSTNSPRMSSFKLSPAVQQGSMGSRAGDD